MPLILEWNVFRWSISSCSSTASFASLKTICRNGSFKPFEVCHCTLLDILPVFMSITTVPVPRIISNTLSTASYAALKVIGSIAPSNHSQVLPCTKFGIKFIFQHIFSKRMQLYQSIPQFISQLVHHTCFYSVYQHNGPFQQLEVDGVLFSTLFH